jgi:protease I
MPSLPAFDNVRILCFVGDDYEDLELWYPKLRLEEAGAVVTLAGQISNHKYIGKNGYPAVSDTDVADMKANDFDGVIVPGGWMPDKLRRDEHVLRLVAEFEAQNKLIASVCHGPWIDISANVVKGYKYTSTPGIKDDVINAGAQWIDASLVVDRNHVSSRRPGDLPDFCKGIIQVLEAQLS